MKSKFFLNFFVPAALVLVADVSPAMAALDFNIYESMGNLVIETSGSLVLPPPVPNNSGQCFPGGAYSPSNAALCTGNDELMLLYAITGTTAFPPGPLLYPADSVSGLSLYLTGTNNGLFVAPHYVPGSPIVSNAIFNGKTLADIGLTPSSGTIGTWTLTGTGDTINVKVGQPVPGPLPVFGAGVAFAVSRRLRRRIQSSRSVVNA